MAGSFGSTPTEDFFLAVIPIGSGNDWIKSCRVPDDVAGVVDLIATESFGWMDILRATTGDGRTAWMANCGGVGFDSHVCERVNQQKERGMRDKMIYLNSLLYTIFHLKAISMLVRADGQEIFSGKALSLAVGNGPYSGGGMRQVPLAANDDGLLDYMVVPKTKLSRLMKEIPRLFAGTVHESALIRSGRCRTLEIAPLDKASADIIEFDGEIEGHLPLTLEVTGTRIRVPRGRA